MDDSAVDLFVDPEAEAERLKEESRRRRQAILEKFKTSGENGKQHAWRLHFVCRYRGWLVTFWSLRSLFCRCTATEGLCTCRAVAGTCEV